MSVTSTNVRDLQTEFSDLIQDLGSFFAKHHEEENGLDYSFHETVGRVLESENKLADLLDRVITREANNSNDESGEMLFVGQTWEYKEFQQLLQRSKSTLIHLQNLAKASGVSAGNDSITGKENNEVDGTSKPKPATSAKKRTPKKRTSEKRIQKKRTPKKRKAPVVTWHEIDAFRSAFDAFIDDVDSLRSKYGWHNPMYEYSVAIKTLAEWVVNNEDGLDKAFKQCRELAAAVKDREEEFDKTTSIKKLAIPQTTEYNGLKRAFRTYQSQFKKLLARADSKASGVSASKGSFTKSSKATSPTSSKKGKASLPITIAITPPDTPPSNKKGSSVQVASTKTAQDSEISPIPRTPTNEHSALEPSTPASSSKKRKISLFITPASVKKRRIGPPTNETNLLDASSIPHTPTNKHETLVGDNLISSEIIPTPESSPVPDSSSSNLTSSSPVLLLWNTQGPVNGSADASARTARNQKPSAKKLAGSPDVQRTQSHTKPKLQLTQTPAQPLALQDTKPLSEPILLESNDPNVRRRYFGHRQVGRFGKFEVIIKYRIYRGNKYYT